MPFPDSSTPFDATLADRLPPPPRNVRRRMDLGRFGLWFGRIFVLPHMLVALGAACALVYILLSLAIPQQVTGRVVHARTHQYKDRPAYTLCYAYEAGGGAHEECESVGQDLYAKYDAGGGNANGDTLVLWRFGLLGFESVRRTRGPEVSDLFLLLWCSIWVGLMSVAFNALWIVPIRMRRLYENGLVARGTIVSKRVSQGRSTRWYATYRFVTDEGAEQQAETTVPRRTAFDALEVGSGVTVIYDPKMPRASVVYELGHFEVEGFPAAG